MTSPFIQRKLVKTIIHTGTEHANDFLHQPVKPQPKMDGKLFSEVVSNLKHTAAINGLISLSAPQIKLKNRIFVILKKHLITYSKWTGYQHLFQTKKPQECYEAIVNPALVAHSHLKIKGDEECPSVDGLKFKVWIPMSNVWQYVKFSELHEKSGKVKPIFEHQQKELTGFYNRIFDHEFRHLEGMTVDIRQVSHNEIYLSDESKQNPQNFIVLRNQRIQREYINDDFFDKSLDKELAQMKRENSEENLKKNANTVSSGSQFDLDSIPQKINPNLKEKLLKSFEKAKVEQKNNQANFTDNTADLNGAEKFKQAQRKQKPKAASNSFKK